MFNEARVATNLVLGNSNLTSSTGDIQTPTTCRNRYSKKFRGYK